MLSPAVLIAIAHVPFVAGATCFGKSPDYDKQCAAFNDETGCDEQVGCEWGEAGETNCFGTNGDPAIDRLCKKFTDATKCGKQIACTWRSDADKIRWVDAITKGVSALATEEPTLPATIAIGSPSYSSVHDHKQIPVADLAAILDAWVTKYGLPSSVVDGLRALVAAESAEYSSYHVALGGPGAEPTVDEFAGGGRNWGGVISIAFNRARTTAGLTRYHKDLKCEKVFLAPKCCMDSHDQATHGGMDSCSTNADCQHIFDPTRDLDASEVQAVTDQLKAWTYPRLSSENVLLKAEIIGGSKDKVAGAAVVV